MRIIAHWEGRVPAFTPSGTFTVVMMGALAGLGGGVAHGLRSGLFRPRAPLRGAHDRGVAPALDLRPE